MSRTVCSEWYVCHTCIMVYTYIYMEPADQVSSWCDLNNCIVVCLHVMHGMYMIPADRLAPECHQPCMEFRLCVTMSKASILASIHSVQAARSQVCV